MLYVRPVCAPLALSGNGLLRSGARPPKPLIVEFIHDMRSQGHTVELTCQVLREQAARSGHGPTERAGRPERAVPARAAPQGDMQARLR